MKSIWRNCGPLDQNNHRALGLTRRDKKSGHLILEKDEYDLIGLKRNQKTLYLLGQRHLKPDEEALCWQLRPLGFITYSLPPRSEIDRSQLREQHGAIRPS